MSVQQQVTVEGTGPGKSHNGASESELNLTLPDRRRGERRPTRPGQRTKCSEASSKQQNYLSKQTASAVKWVKGVINLVSVIP